MIENSGHLLVNDSKVQILISSIDNLPDREILEISTDINCLIAWVISWKKGNKESPMGRQKVICSDACILPSANNKIVL